MSKTYTATVEHGNLIKGGDTNVYSDAITFTSRHEAGTKENRDDAVRAWRDASGVCWGYAFAFDVKEA